MLPARPARQPPQGWRCSTPFVTSGRGRARAARTKLAAPTHEGRPYGGGQGVPATNAQIAVELHLSVDAVKTHLRAVAHRFGIDHLPQNEKRLRTAYLAIQLGLSSP